MQRRAKLAGIACLTAILCLSHIQTASAVVARSYSLTACVDAIADPLYTRDTIATIIGYANGDALQTAITGGSIYLYVATGSGLIAVGDGDRQNNPDLYCGNSDNNSVTYLDSSGSKDYFFGGAGDDSVTSSWDSKFYGGPGNDSVNNLTESSYFDGGPGNDFVTTLSGSAIFDGGPGNDSVGTLSNPSTFNGGPGYDEVTGSSSGTFNPGDQDVTPPTITSSATFLAAENQTAIGTLTANEAVTWSVVSGVDSTTVNLVSATGVLTFKVAPNFELPTDSGANNVYNLTIRATDSAGNSTDQAIAITVSDIFETSSFTLFGLAGSVTTATYRTAILITAEVNVAAKIRFKVNGVVIPSCKNKSATGSLSSYIATCSWKASRRGALTLTASATPIASGIAASNALPINVWVNNRTMARS